ncbi:hypothetical protein C7999DRAFT_39563 [Corynascus novoguineensis]|uniref:Dystroglycan-type cadherin-like domain-containing protein n=1 Tax=Corynascus novoguineensis TaxID=1126955 RepID=A0AAN7CXX8_9PEZI|nr:hypothetical protein C7999DRAFT_39563 [Corynascus novoguineensis]
MVSLSVRISATALLLGCLSTASPMVSFPINSQVPPVARLGEPFSFVFSPSTFTSNSRVTYSLLNPPKWLSIDSDARRLFGTPKQDDAVLGRVTGVPVSLVATDEFGSTTLQAVLVVSGSSGPRLAIHLQDQVPSFGTFSNPSSILSTPGKVFSFQLRPNTFSKPPDATISYYATMGDNTPLPAWISFNAANLRFSGQTPTVESLVQLPQRFSFRVIATDVVGFAGATMDFDLIVGPHELAADKTAIILNATHGVLLSYNGLRDNVKVDGKPAVPGSVVVVSTPHVPRWLSTDEKTWQISGIPPDTAESTNFTVTLRDNFSNKLDLTVLVNVDGDQAGLSKPKTPEFIINPGEAFSFDLRSFLSDTEITEIAFKQDSSYAWIHLNPHTVTLYGDAPLKLNESVEVKFEARSKKSNASSSLSLRIVVRSNGKGSGSTAADNPATGEDINEFSSGLRSSGGNRGFNPAALIVFSPLLPLLAVSMYLLFWSSRRRKNNREPALSARDLSQPLPATCAAEHPGFDALDTLPGFTQYCDTTSSADDIVDTEKRGLPKSFQGSSLTTTRIPQPTEPRGSQNADGEPLSTMRSGVRDKVSSFPSSIIEVSIGELVDCRGPKSAGRDNRRSFRHRFEISDPRHLRTSGTVHTGSPSPTWTPQPGSSRAVRETAMSPGPDVDTSYDPPASEQRLPWPWLKVSRGRWKGTQVVPGMQKVNEQPRLSTVDTFASDPNGGSSSTMSAMQERVADDSATTSIPSRLSSRVFLNPPPNRRGGSLTANRRSPSIVAPVKSPGTRSDAIVNSTTTTTTFLPSLVGAATYGPAPDLERLLFAEDSFLGKKRGGNGRAASRQASQSMGALLRSCGNQTDYASFIHLNHDEMGSQLTTWDNGPRHMEKLQ